jgi:hypothetical protein
MAGSALLFSKICIYDYMQGSERTEYLLREPKQYNTNSVKVFDYYDLVKEFCSDKVSTFSNRGLMMYQLIILLEMTK